MAPSLGLAGDVGADARGRELLPAEHQETATMKNYVGVAHHRRGTIGQQVDMPHSRTLRMNEALVSIPGTTHLSMTCDLCGARLENYMTADQNIGAEMDKMHTMMDEHQQSAACKQA
jgi:hypothetical protein